MNNGNGSAMFRSEGKPAGLCVGNNDERSVGNLTNSTNLLSTNFLSGENGSLSTTRSIRSDRSSSNMTRRAVAGTAATVALRLVSFGCTQWTYRRIADNPAVLGSATIPLELLLTTTLFISREGFRLAFLSSSSSSPTTRTRECARPKEPERIQTEHDKSIRKARVESNCEGGIGSVDSAFDRDDEIHQTHQMHHENHENHENDSWIALAWCTIPVTTISSLSALLWHLRMPLFFQTNRDAVCRNDCDGLSTNAGFDYQLAGMLFCLAACIEGYGEPAVLMSLRDLDATTKASAEGIAIVAKTAILPVLLSTFSTHPISAFGVAQVVYSLSYTFFLYWKHRQSLLSWTSVLSSRNVSRHRLLSVAIFTVQGLIKHALTEGDRIVLTMLAGSYDQGVYAMGSSYGGLAARLLLQPLEENARLLWSRMVVTSIDLSSAATASSNTTTTAAITNTTTTAATATSLADTTNNTDEPQSTNSCHPLQLNNKTNSNDLFLRTSYTALVKLVLYIGFIFSCLAVNYTRILLVVLAGAKWGTNRQASAVLSAFCTYTAFLAWNGMTEAFLYAIIASSPSTTSYSNSDDNNDNDVNDTTGTHHTSTNNNSSSHQHAKQLATDMGRLSIAHTFVGLTFAIVASIAVAWYGTVGLVFANCVAMGVRSIYAVTFAAQYFVRQSNYDIQKEFKNQKGSNTTDQTTTITFWQMFRNLLREMFPKPVVIVAFLVSFLVTRLSLLHMESVQQRVATGSVAWYKLALKHISVGVTSAIGILTLASSVETEFQYSLRSMWKGRQSVQTTYVVDCSTKIVKLD